MPQFVRGGLRHDRWLETQGRAPLNFPADVITDLVTKGDQLSVFEVTDAVQPERIAIAVVAGKSNYDQTAYAVIDGAAILGLGITMRKTPGGTHDPVVNGLHYDLDVGTADKLIALAGLIASGRIEPVLKDKVKSLLRAGFENGQLDYKKNKTLANRVNAMIPAEEPAPPPQQ